MLKTPPVAHNAFVAILRRRVKRLEYFKIITIHAYAFKRQHSLNTLVCLQYVQIYTFFFVIRLLVTTTLASTRFILSLFLRMYS